MIFFILDVLARRPEMLPVVVLAYFGGLIVAFTLHELAHAMVAWWLGDPTARNYGRITLNPLAHLDPLGLILILLAGFGWAKPVPFNPYRLRFGPRTGSALVAAAGPAMNLILAFLFAVPIRLGLIELSGGLPASYGDVAGIVEFICMTNVSLNVLLCIFNLLPLAPLDGFRIAVAVTPKDLSDTLLRLEPYGMFILFGLFALGYVFRIDVFGSTIGPVISGTTRALVGV
ncbi:MAG: peptidase [Dehalococcoidia bacterium]|nr:MAG: peptidase [Dehalococcoidia bacterium]